MITSAPLSISVAGGGAPILSFGEQLQLQAKFSDESKQGETSWTSSRTDIVTVDAQTGDLTAANVPSDATVTVSSIVNKQSLSSTCRVYVAQVRFKAVNPHTVPLLSSARFRTDVLPATLPDAHLVWSVSDTTIATIDSLSGVLLTRGRVGHLTVTARLRANEKVFATHEVYIVPASIDLLPLFPDEPLERGHSYGFKLLLEPEAENESELSVTYSVSDPTVAVVSDDSIYAVGEGTAVIRVYVQQAPDAILSDSITVRVFNPAARVEVPESLPVGLGDIFDVPVALFPDDVSEVKLNWISKNPAVVAVRPDGRFTASALGTALLIVSTSTGLSDTCEVQVGASVIRMDAQSLTLQKETSFPLSVSFVPISAHDDVLWSTSDPSVVVVDKTGLVTAVGAGQAKVIASTGARADTCRVTVIESTAGLSFYFVENYKVMSPGEDFTIPLINATGQSATWHTDNPYVANVNNRGVVTTYSLGTAAISAISSDGVKAQCIVSVQATSIDVPMTKAASIDYRFGKLFVKGLAGHNILVTSLAGQVKAAFIPSGDDESRPLYLPVGIYVIRSFGGPRQAVYKVVVR
ncbi:MAG: Ig-like domain-containing protein [Tannerellaceae bacterium]|jgi:uncharacterized protein YjdB|nr:Ig-like domain-containing protein [Tannerellaceae bacterium]